MNLRRRHLFLLLPFGLLLSACEDTAKDSTGFSGEDRLEAMQSGTVLPGMTPSQVQRIWGPPHKKERNGGSDDWIYYTGPKGSGYDVHTTVTFTQGKVSNIMNGDLMNGRDRSHEPIPQVAPDMSRSPGTGMGTGGASFQALPGAGGVGF
jgi:hypothetical protein